MRLLEASEAYLEAQRQTQVMTDARKIGQGLLRKAEMAQQAAADKLTTLIEAQFLADEDLARKVLVELQCQAKGIGR